MSSPSDSNHQPIIVMFPDPTNTEHFTRPPTESLIEEPINPTPSSSGTMSPDHQYTDETEWSIINQTTTTTTQDQPEHNHNQEPASNPPRPGPITAEPVVVPILQSPELKCQDWIDQLPATEDEPESETIPDDDTRDEVSTTSLENPPQDDQQQQPQASHQQDSIMDAHEEVLHASQYTSELAPYDSASQCVYHRPARLNLTPIVDEPVEPLIVEQSAEPPIVELPTESAELDASVDLSHSYMSPDELSRKAANSLQNISVVVAPEPLTASASGNPPQNPPSSVSSRSSSRHSEPKPTPLATPAPPQTLTETPPSSSAPAPEVKKPSPHYSRRSLSFLLFILVVLISFLCRQYYSENLIMQKLPLRLFTRGPDPAVIPSQAISTAELAESASDPAPLGEQDTLIDTLPPATPSRKISTPPIPLVDDDVPSEPEQVVKVDSPLPDSDQQPKHIPVSYPQELSPNVADSNLLEGSFAARRAELLPEDRWLADGNQTLASATNDHDTGSSSFLLVGCMIIFSIYTLGQTIRAKPAPLLSVEEMISEFESKASQDYARACSDLQGRLEQISTDTVALTKLMKSLEKRIRTGVYPRAERGLLAWAHGARGDKESCAQLWRRFWDAGHGARKPARSSPMLLLDFVEELGRASLAAAEQHPPEPSAVSEKPSALKPDPDAVGAKREPVSPVHAHASQPSVRKSTRRKSSLGTAVGSKKTAEHPVQVKRERELATLAVHISQVKVEALVEDKRARRGRGKGKGKEKDGADEPDNDGHLSDPTLVPSPTAPKTKPRRSSSRTSHPSSVSPNVAAVSPKTRTSSRLLNKHS